MINRWNDADAREYASQYEEYGDLSQTDIMSQAYATTLLGADNDLTMHGGGNTSVKTTFSVNDTGAAVRALYVKASGTPLCEFTPNHFVVMDLDFLESLRSKDALDDETMSIEFKRHRLSTDDKLPSIESLMHAFISAKIVSHTHPAAILAIVNRKDGAELFKRCFGDDLAVIPYARMGFDLAKAVSSAARENPGCSGVVMRHHGLIVWGDCPHEVYDRTIDIVTMAEEFLEKIKSKDLKPLSTSTSVPSYVLLDAPDVMELIGSSVGKEIICNPPLTPDYPMYARIRLRWVDDISDIPVPTMDVLPLAVVHPTIGILCYGADEAAAKRTSDFVRQALSIRRRIFETGGVYESLAEEFILDMQYRGYQQAKG